MGTENQMMMKVSVRPELKVSQSADMLGNIHGKDGSIEALVSADNTPFNSEMGFTAGEPVDSGDHSGSGGGFFTWDIPRSTSKTYVDDEGWVSQRKPKPVRAPVVSEAGKGSEKLLKKDDEGVHAFIDLESTEIDFANAPYLTDNINEVLLRPLNLECDNVTVYTLDNLDRTIRQRLYKGRAIIKKYQQRTALCKPCKLLQGWGQKLPLLEIEMITDIGKHCLDLQDIDQLNKQPVVIITNDDYGVGGFANLLKNQFGVRVIRTLPKGMKTIPIYKYLSQEEYSQLLTRAARLRQAAEDMRYEQAAGQASFLSPPQ